MSVMAEISEVRWLKPRVVKAECIKRIIAFLDANKYDMDVRWAVSSIHLL